MAGRRSPPRPTNPDPATPPEEVFFAIGRIVGAHGVRGEAKMVIYTQRPERLRDLRRVYFDDDPTPQRLISSRLHAGQALLTLEGVTDREGAEALRGTIVRIAGNQAHPAGRGGVYHYQLIGLSVFTEDGTRLGELTDIIESGEVDVYVVRDSAGGEHTVSGPEDVVLEIDPAADRVVVRPQEWETIERVERPPRVPPPALAGPQAHAPSALTGRQREP